MANRPSTRSTRDKFCIGQRVIWKPGPPCARGRTAEFRGTVISQRAWLQFRDGGQCSWRYRLELDGFGTLQEGYWFAALEKELRPIYDGDQVVSWSTCAWRPNAVTVARLEPLLPLCAAFVYAQDRIRVRHGQEQSQRALRGTPERDL